MKKEKRDLYEKSKDGDLIPVQPDTPQLDPILDEDAPLPERIKAFAKLKYSPYRIAQALGYSEAKSKTFIERLHDETSEEHRAYKKGLILGDAEIENGLKSAAAGGDSFSAMELFKRQNQRKTDAIKKELFNI